MRKMGCKPGVPDFIVITRPPAFPDVVGVVLELKASGGKVTRAQRDWLDDFQDARWLAFLAVGAGDAINKFKACGYVLGGR